MLKRALDLACSACVLLLSSPVILAFMFLIWRQDGHSPFYIAPRVGRSGKIFSMVKLRSMVVGADRSGVDSTAGDDARITRVGQLVRRYKLDELTQLWNVLRGDMSVVGPRPQVERDVSLYTPEERRLLSVRPGITDFSSIVFADEGEILEGASDPDLRYNQVIRPWKSRLSLFGIDHGSMGLDVQIIVTTALALLTRRVALRAVSRMLESRGASPELVKVAGRREPLIPAPPPGAAEIVKER